MKPPAFEFVPAAALLALLLYRPDACAWNGTIWPYTPQAFSTLYALRQTAMLDRWISRAWEPHNPAIGELYYVKACDAQRLIEKLENSEPVPSLAVERVIDNRDASRLGGEYWNVPDGPTRF